MKRGSNRVNNGYLGYNQADIPYNGVVGSQKNYNVALRDLPFYPFGNTGNAFGIPDGNYVRPPEWLALPSVTAGSQQIVGLFAVYNDESNVCAVQVQGAYNVDWGDGTTGAFLSNTVATKRYDQTSYSGLTSSVVASRGNNYKTVLIKITPQTGQNLTTVDFVATPTGITGYSAIASSQWLDIRMSAPNLTTLTVSKWYASSISNRYLELFEFVGEAALTSFNFISSFSLKKIISFPSTRTISVGASWQSLFHTCFSLQELPSSILDGINRVSTLAYSFYYNQNLRKLPLETLNLSNCTSMEGAFLQCFNITRLPVFTNTNKITNYNSAFANCVRVEEIPYLDTSACTNFGSMFSACYGLKRIQNTFPGASGTNFQGMFQNCGLPTLPTINTSNGTNFQSFISSMMGIQTIPKYDYSKATNLSFFARFAGTLTHLPDFNTTSALTNTSFMFDNCISLVACPNFSGFTGVNNTQNMFTSCAALRTIPSITMGNVTTSTNTFGSNGTLASVGLIGISFTFALNTSGNNIMGPTALNNLYTNLATVGASGSNARTISVSGNWGFTASNRSIATGKGWLVN